MDQFEALEEVVVVGLVLLERIIECSIMSDWKIANLLALTVELHEELPERNLRDDVL